MDTILDIQANSVDVPFQSTIRVVVYIIDLPDNCMTAMTGLVYITSS